MARRAERSQWSAPDPAGLLEDDRFVPSGKSDPRLGISAGDYAEGYVQESDFEDLVADHLLVPARGPENVLLRKVHRPVPVPLPWLVIAADLADGDAREAQQAALLLEKDELVPDQPIAMPVMTEAQEAGWHALMDLYEAIPEGWALVGGQLVHLWCAERQTFVARPTDDADAVLDVREHPDIHYQVTAVLQGMGFTPETNSDGVQHRWVKDKAVIDLLIP